MATAIANAAVVWSLGKPGSAAWWAKRWMLARLGDERPRAVHDAREHLREREREPAAQTGGDGRAAARPPPVSAGQEEQRDESAREEQLGRVGIAHDRVLDPVVMGEEAVDGVHDRPVHRRERTGTEVKGWYSLAGQRTPIAGVPSATGG